MGHIKHPEIFVQLAGEDGNAFAILGRVQRAMRRASLPQEEITLFTEEATKGDYESLLRTVMTWVEVT